jgi:carbamoyl-phosphate synthase large subunit
VFKVNEGRPNAVDRLKAGAIQLAVYTTAGAPAFFDEKAIRRSAVTHRVSCISTMSGARAAAEAMAARKRDLHPGVELAGDLRAGKDDGVKTAR